MSINVSPEARTALLEQPTLSVAEFAVVLGIGVNSAYGLVRERRVRSMKVGRKIVIPADAVRQLLAEV